VSEWESFFVAEAGASAALAGLVFVGVSINLDKVLSAPGLPGRAGEALVVLLAVLITASLLLVPGQPWSLVGLELLVVGLADWVAVGTIIQRSSRRKWAPLRPHLFVFRVVLGQLATLPFVLAGGAVLLWGGNGLYLLVPGVIASFVVAFLDAWILLIEINR
jgi:modulator of FtsH protease